MYFGWKVIAVVEAIVLTGLLGFLTRYYVGKKLVQLVDYVILNVPLLGKIYGTVKQVNQAFTSEKKSSFKQVVMVEFPRKGLFSVGFVTAEQVRRPTKAKASSASLCRPHRTRPPASCWFCRRAR